MEAKEPDNLPLHEPWYSRLSKFHRLVVIAALRVDKLLELVYAFVSDHVGFKFVDPISKPDLGRVLAEGKTDQPIVFFTGNDQAPNSVRKYGAKKSVPVKTISMGTGDVVRKTFDLISLYRPSYLICVRIYILYSLAPLKQRLKRRDYSGAGGYFWRTLRRQDAIRAS